MRDLHPAVDLRERDCGQQTIVSSTMHPTVSKVTIRTTGSHAVYCEVGFGKPEVRPARTMGAAEVIAIAGLTGIASDAPPGAAIAIVLTSA
jgi:hypothetical protein